MNRYILKFASICVLSYSLTTYAEIYKHIDANGQVTYSNIPTKGATKLDLGINPKSEETKTYTRTPQQKYTSPSNFPRVDRDTQTQRDSKRKSILQTELDTESKSLSEANKSLTDIQSAITELKSKPNTSNQIAKIEEKIKEIQSDIENHQNNIVLLKKELGSTK